MRLEANGIELCMLLQNCILDQVAEPKLFAFGKVGLVASRDGSSVAGYVHMIQWFTHQYSVQH